MAEKKDVNQLLDELRPTLQLLNRNLGSLSNKVVDVYATFSKLSDKISESVDAITSSLNSFQKKLDATQVPQQQKQTPRQQDAGFMNVGNILKAKDLEYNFETPPVISKPSEPKKDNNNVQKTGLPAAAAAGIVSKIGPALGRIFTGLFSTGAGAVAGAAGGPAGAAAGGAAGAARGAAGAAAGAAGKTAAPTAMASLMKKFNTLSTVSGLIVKAFAAIPAAVIAFTTALSMFTKAVRSYVAAYNPNVVKQFDYVMKDLSAVIGRALQPILVSLGSAFRFLADALIPVTDALAPAFAAIAQAVQNFLLPIFNALANALKDAAPRINALAQIFARLMGELGGAIADVIPDMVEYFIDLARAFMELIPSIALLFDISKFAISIMRAFIQAFVLIMKPINLVIDGFRKLADYIKSWTDWLGLTKKQNKQQAELGNSTGMAAREAQYMNVEDLSRNLIKAAYASGIDIQRAQLDAQRQMVGQLAQINQKVGQNQVPARPQAGIRMA